MQVKHRKQLLGCSILAVAAIGIFGCSPNKEVQERAKRERAVLKAFYASQVPVDGKHIEFSWAGYRWRVPRYFRAAEVGHTDKEVTGFYINSFWVDGKLFVDGDPTYKSAAAAGRLAWRGVGLMPDIREEQIHAEYSSSKRLGRGKAMIVPGIAYIVYARDGSPTSEDSFEATELKDRLGYPITFSCHRSMDDVTSGRVFDLPKDSWQGQCDGTLMIRPGVGVRYRFHTQDLSQSLQLAESIMDLFDSWIVEE